MAVQRTYRGVTITARVIDQGPLSDGSTALDIHNFRIERDNILDSTFRIMPLIGSSWCTATHPTAFTTDRGIIGMAFARINGDVPEILLFGANNVFRFAPWLRDNATANGGLETQLYYEPKSVTHAVAPQAKQQYPMQSEVIGNRIYFTYCDGGQAWVWDGDTQRLRPFGYPHTPSPPSVEGPASPDTRSNDIDDSNQAGFSVRGRIGSTEEDWTTVADGVEAVVGGVDVGQWDYYVVFEGPDGSYSATSPVGGSATMRKELCASSGTPVKPTQQPENLQKMFRVFNIPRGQVPTEARILLRTANLRRLPTNDFGEPRFLHRISNNQAIEYIDNIPDGELGPIWENRQQAPAGFMFLRSFSGSLFCARTHGHPSRVWWSEQTSLSGSTPESFIQGHWKDVYPNTGPITGTWEAQLGTDASTPVMLVFKRNSCHFASGSYPNWTFGTIHATAGLEGPELVRSLPDGSTLWYGNGTFWRLDSSGQAQDVGEPIRKTLQRINQSTAHMGHSWVNQMGGEARFLLPIDDSVEPNYQFIWDYRTNGWRTADGVEVRAALNIPGENLTLLSGTFDGQLSVWVYNRGYPGSGFDSAAPQWLYRSGWTPLDFRRGTQSLHRITHPVEAILMLEDRHSGTARLRARIDWRTTNEVNETESVVLSHPEDDGNIPFYGSALYDTDSWRERRYYSSKSALGLPDCEVFSLTLSGTDEPIALQSIDVYGEVVAEPGGRTPQIAEDDR